jgi:hypothetical protein
MTIKDQDEISQEKLQAVNLHNQQQQHRACKLAFQIDIIHEEE